MTAIYARISFTDNLIDSTDLQGTDPILSGASGRLWLSTTTHELRLELQGENGDAQVVVNNGAFSIYDPMSNTVYKGTLPTERARTTGKAGTDTIPTVAQIQSQLNQLTQNIDVAGPMPRNVAGQPAYKVVLTPKHSGGLLGSVQLAWDARARRPARDRDLLDEQQHAGARAEGHRHLLRGGVRQRVQGRPAGRGEGGQDLDAGEAPKAHSEGQARQARGKAATDITGAAAVQAHLPFTLVAPNTLDGLPQQSVQLLDWGGSPAALVTYGQGLGGIAVIEQTASSQSSPASQSRAMGPPGAEPPDSLDQWSHRPGAPDRARDGRCASRTAASSTPCSARCRRTRRNGGGAVGALNDVTTRTRHSPGGAPGSGRSSAR